MEALELRNRQLVEYIEGLERDLAGRMAHQVMLAYEWDVTLLLLFVGKAMAVKR